MLFVDVVFLVWVWQRLFLSRPRKDARRTHQRQKTQRAHQRTIWSEIFNFKHNLNGICALTCALTCKYSIFMSGNISGHRPKSKNPRWYGNRTPPQSVSPPKKNSKRKATLDHYFFHSNCIIYTIGICAVLPQVFAFFSTLCLKACYLNIMMNAQIFICFIKSWWFFSFYTGWLCAWCCFSWSSKRATPRFSTPTGH